MSKARVKIPGTLSFGKQESPMLASGIIQSRDSALNANAVPWLTILYNLVEAPHGLVSDEEYKANFECEEVLLFKFSCPASTRVVLSR